MARVGVSITKSCLFRGATQEFSNVYYFDVGATLPSQADAEDLIDKVVVIERTLHSASVTFVRGRCWSAGGSEATNNMIAQKNLTGTGSGPSDTSQDRERAMLVKLRAGSDSRGNPVFLRKWFHSCGAPQGQAVFAGPIQANTAQLSTSQKSAIEGQANLLKSVAYNGGVGILCAKSGRQFTLNAAFQSHNYLEHHQLGDQWRAQ